MYKASRIVDVVLSVKTGLIFKSVHHYKPKRGQKLAQDAIHIWQQCFAENLIFVNS